MIHVQVRPCSHAPMSRIRSPSHCHQFSPFPFHCPSPTPRPLPPFARPSPSTPGATPDHVLFAMAMHLEHHLAAPPEYPDHHAVRWVSSPPAAGALDALDLISRQHGAVARHTFQHISPYTLTPASGLLDLAALSTPFVPGCCVLNRRSSSFFFPIFPTYTFAPDVPAYSRPLEPPPPPPACR